MHVTMRDERDARCATKLHFKAPPVGGAFRLGDDKAGRTHLCRIICTFLEGRPQQSQIICIYRAKNITYSPKKQLRLKKWCKAISLLPSNLHYATSLQALKSLSITCKRWSIVFCVHGSFLGCSSKRRERLSMKCVATNHSSF